MPARSGVTRVWLGFLLLSGALRRTIAGLVVCLDGSVPPFDALGAARTKRREGAWSRERERALA